MYRDRHIDLLFTIVKVFPLVLTVLFKAEAQVPISSFSVESSTICRYEQVDLTNTSVDGDAFFWDFCGGDFASFTPVAENVLSNSLFNFSFDLELVESDGNWYGFTIGRNSNKLVRLDFGGSLGGIPTAQDLGVIEGSNGANAISFYQESGNWFALVGNSNISDIIRVNFGNSLLNTPIYDAIVTGLNFQNITDIEIQEIVGDNLYGFFMSFSRNKIYYLNFGESILNHPIVDSLEIIDGPSSLSDLSFYREGNSWYGLLLSFNDATIQLLDYGTSLLSTPVASTLASFSSVSDGELFSEGGEVYGLIERNTGQLARLEFGSTVTNTPNVTDLGNLGGVIPRSTFSFSLANDSSSWWGYGIDFSTNTLSSYQFSGECFADESISSELNPQISYSESSTNRVVLEVTNSVGANSFTSQDLTVTNDVSPSIAFIVDDSRCISNLNTFTPSNSGLTSYSWDFDGDGVEDSNEESPIFDYSTLGSGTYTVRLDVNDGTCGNFIEEEITIYDAPPTPSFTVTTSTTLCTNNELILTNTTDESGFDNVLTYQWVIDGDLVDRRDTVYTFTTPGVKTVTLQSFLPGCSSVITSQDVTIDEGPEVSFTYTNNCFGEAIQFTSTVIGNNITSYSWDFGDGSGMSSQADTVYQYATAGTYTVALTVTNASGCTTVYSDDVDVNNQPLVDFTFDKAIENIPINFQGFDLTLSGDEVVSWLWDFGELGSSTEVNPAVTFADPAIYEISLSIETSQGCIATVMKNIQVNIADFPTSSFALESTSICIEEKVAFSNTSVNGDAFFWDFCGGDFASFAPVAENVLTNSLFNSSFDLELVESDGNWYGFTIGRNSNKLVRLDFGGSLGGIPTAQDLGVIEGSNGANAISFYQESGNWFALVGNSNISDIIRVNFGNSLLNTPTYDAIVTGLNFQNITDIEIQEIVGDNLYGFFMSFSRNKIYYLNFGESILNNPIVDSLEIIDGPSSLSDLSFYREGNSWYGLLLSFNDATIQLLDYGTSLLSTPVASTLASFSSVSDGELFSEGGEVYGLIERNTGQLARLEFGSTVTNTPNVTDLGNLGGVIPSSTFSFSLANDSSSWWGYGIDFSTNTLSSYQFSGECFADESISSELNPQISYSESSTNRVVLEVTNSVGANSFTSQDLTVTNDVSPSIAFIVDDSRCISNPNTFTPSITGLTSYSWDFDGDGVEDSNEESPIFDYSTLGSGTYTVRLDVNDGTCGNFIEEEITIYEAPPVPSYQVATTSRCLNTPISFTNSTADESYDGPLVYEWEFIDDATSTVLGTSTDRDASFSFSSVGEKTIRLTSSIPGCEEVIEQSITIIGGPQVAFTSSPVCQYEAMQFTNSSVDAESYLWDFGDGFTSTAENPDHVFTAAGTYSVSLTGTNADGCTTTETRTVSVSDLPQVNFDFDTPCNSSSGTLFMDLSTVNNADILAWQWFVDGEEVSTAQNPTLNFTEAGTRTIMLAVTSSNGCEATYMEDVEVSETPAPDFAATIGCVGEETLLEDITAFPSGTITSWLWNVNGENFFTQDVSYVFTEAGIYDVTLEAIGNNFCSESITKSIEILQLPTVDFTVNGDCDNIVIEAEDLSAAANDPIVSRTWMLDGQNVGNGSNLLLNNLADGTYDLMLQVETSAGCVTSRNQALEVNASPTAAFSFPRSYGLPGDAIVFSNTSAGAATYEWFVNENTIGTNATQESVQFADAGTYQVSLVAENSLGCADTVMQEVLIAVPSVDLSLKNFDLIEENGTGKILLEIENLSNLPIDSVVVDIELENSFQVKEQVNRFIDIGGSASLSLNVGIPIGLAEPAYFCVTLTSPFRGFEDENPFNNEKCLTLQPQVRVEDPFPNPVRDEFRLKVVLPQSEEITLSLFNSAGKLELQQINQAVDGLNNFIFDMSQLNPGVYYITIDVAGQLSQRKIIKL